MLQQLPDLQRPAGHRRRSAPAHSTLWRAYGEIFIIRQGHGLLTIGDREIAASVGQIVIVPPNIMVKDGAISRRA
jgi:hypothetical protein